MKSKNLTRTQRTILERARDRDPLRTRHVRSLSKWRTHVQELEDLGLLVRIGHGRWEISRRGRQLLDRKDDQDPQATLNIV